MMNTKLVSERPQTPGGVAGWLLKRLRGDARRQPRLAIVERISLAPRQSLSLVEVEGRRLLIATSAEGAPAFYSLDDRNAAKRIGRGPGAVIPTGTRSW